MRRMLSLVLVLVLVVVPVAAADAGSVKPGSSLRMTVTGEIRQLDAKKIVIGHVVCTIPVKLSVSVGRFVIGDPVRISCLDGRLNGVRYSPTTTNQTDGPATGDTTPTLTTPGPSCGLSCAKSLTYSIGTISEGGGPSGDTSTVTGPITDISDGSIAAGGLTCSYTSIVENFINQVARVGDNVTLTCTGGVFIGMKSVGTINR